MKGKNITIIAIILIAIIAIVILTNSSNSSTEAEVELTQTEENQNELNENSPRGNGGSIDRESMPNYDLLQEMLATTANKFIQLEYTNEENQITLPYNLFIPENYTEDKSYPLVLFIHDASVVGDDVMNTLTQGFGALVWVTDEFQAENECFVLAPQFTETIANDQAGLSDMGYETVNLINEIVSKYNIDENRIYTTGQSMGGMTSIALNIAYPDLFAASFYVACQWDVELMRELADDKMFFIVSEGDPKASPSMDNFIEILNEENAEYAFATWNAQWTPEEFDEAVQNILSENKDINLVKFVEGSTVPEGSEGLLNNPSGEHMLTWCYTYLIDGVRDWLFAQSK